MAANILGLCDALATRITAGLDAPGDATVNRVYIDKQSVPNAAGLQVWVFPVRDNQTPVTRGEDEWTYEVAVVVTDWYADPAPVADDWLDAKKLFAEVKVAMRMDFTRDTFNFGSPLRRVQLVPAAERPVYDAEALVAKKLFWWEAVFEFRELLTA